MILTSDLKHIAFAMTVLLCSSCFESVCVKCKCNVSFFIVKIGWSAKQTSNEENQRSSFDIPNEEGRQTEGLLLFCFVYEILLAKILKNMNHPDTLSYYVIRSKRRLHIEYVTIKLDGRRRLYYIFVILPKRSGCCIHFVFLEGFFSGHGWMY